MEVVGDEKMKVILEVVVNHVLEEPTDNEEIGLQKFGFNVFDKYEEGVIIERSSEYTYLLMLIKLWPGDCISKLKMMNQKADEDNTKALNKGNVRYRKFCRFSSNEFWENIGCLVSAPAFGLEGSRLWEKEEEIKLSLKKGKRS